MDSLFLLAFFASIVALVVGLIRPTTFSFLKGEITRVRLGKIFGVAAIVSFVLFGMTVDPSKKESDEVTRKPVEKNSEQVVQEKSASSTPIEESIKTDPTPSTVEVKNIPEPITAPTPTASAPTETISQKNALKKAKSYLGYTAFSHDGLVAQLEYEKFSHSDAVYGADNSGADWNEQAAKKAKSYMDYSAFSRGSLIEQLKFDKFSQTQAEYGADAVGL